MKTTILYNDWDVLCFKARIFFSDNWAGLIVIAVFFIILVLAVIFVGNANKQLFINDGIYEDEYQKKMLKK